MKEYYHLKPEDLLRKMIREYRNYLDNTIIKYGLKMIRLTQYNIDDWTSIQSSMLNLWVKFPEFSDVFIDIFKINEQFVKKSLLKKALYSIIDRCIQRHYEQEMLWAVWCIKVFDINISQNYIKKIFNSKNWLSIIIALDIVESKNMKSSRKVNNLLVILYDEIKEEQQLKKDTNDLLWSKIWLLIYEIEINEWLLLDNREKFQYSQSNKFFKELINLKVNFYNSNYIYNCEGTSEKNQKFVTLEKFNEALSKLRPILIDDQNKKVNMDNELARNKENILHKLFSEIIQEEY